MDLADLIVMLPVLLFSVMVHEVAHGWVALKCGDPTARDAGRLTFNPIPHIDPFMTVILPLFLIVQRLLGGSFFIIGGAKPVPVNPYNLRGGEKDNLKVTIAGPASNLLLASAAFVIAGVVVLLSRSLPSPLLLALLKLMDRVILLNLVLANFNLIPIPPLDGSWVLSYFLRGEAKEAYRRLQASGFRVFTFFLVATWLIPGLFKMLFSPAALLYGIFWKWLQTLAT